jgi:hypothetical protein
MVVAPWIKVMDKPIFVFDERSLEKISDIKEQGFMNVSDIMEMANSNNEIYLTAYRAGQDAGLKASAAVVSRLSGAIEDYLDGESQNNVSGLRQALAFAAVAK